MEERSHPVCRCGFYPGDVFGTKAAGFSELCEGRVGGEVGADDKEFILNEEEQGIVFGPISCLSKESYVGIEFIDGSIGFEPRIVFGGTLSSY